MPRSRIIYNTQDIFCGPSDLYDFKLLYNTHILQRLDRVQSASYSVDYPRIDIGSVGRRDHIQIQNGPPSVSLSYQYLVSDIANEIRCGLSPCYNINGILQSSSSGNFFDSTSSEDKSRDSRNFYLVASKTASDLRTYLGAIHTGTSGSFSDTLDSQATGYNLICFISSYLKSYSMAASIGDFLKVDMSYDCDSLAIYNSASGQYVPVLDSVSGTLISNPIQIALPKPYQNPNQPTVLRPGDITISYLSDYGYNFNDASFDWDDLKVQNFNWSVNIERTPISYLGEKLYCARPARNPIVSNFSFGGLVGDYKSGFLGSFFLDDTYRSGHFIITIRNPLTGLQNYQQTALRIEAKGAKILNFGTSESIGSNKAFNLAFSCENSPDDLATYGVFVSGVVANPQVFSGVLTTEAGEYITWEDGSIMRLEDIVITPNTF